MTWSARVGTSMGEGRGMYSNQVGPDPEPAPGGPQRVRSDGSGNQGQPLGVKRLKLPAFAEAADAQVEQLAGDAGDALQAGRLRAAGAARAAADDDVARALLRAEHADRELEVQEERVGRQLVRDRTARAGTGTGRR